MRGLRGQFVRYVSLNMLGMAGLSCYILADTFFIAKGMGGDGLTALNLVLPVYSVINGLGLMIGMGGGTRYAISRKGSVFPSALALAAIPAVLFPLLGLFGSRPLAALLGAEGAVLDMAAEYLRVLLLFTPMFLLNNILVCFVRNDGEPRLSMAAMAVGSLSNIVLDYVYIFPCGMGMFGAALATGTAPVVGTLLLTPYLRGRTCGFSLRKGRARPAAWGDMALLGMPSLIGELSSGTVILVFNSLLLGLGGNTAVAAYGVVANCALVITALFTGVAQGVQPLISEAWGGGRPGEAARLIRWGSLLTVALAVLVYLLAAVWQTGPLVALFNEQGDPVLAALAEEGIRLYFLAFFFQGVNIVAATGFSAMEQGRRGFLVSLLRGLVLVIPGAVLMAELWGITGVWLASAAAEGLTLVPTLRWLLGEKKRKKSGNLEETP